MDSMLDENLDVSNNCITRRLFAINGTMEIKGNYTIDNCFYGSLKIDGNLTIEAEGAVIGSIEANNLTIYGQFTGKAKIKSVLDIKKNAFVSGTIKTEKAKSNNEAEINGEIRITNNNMQNICLEEIEDANSLAGFEKVTEKNINTH